MRRTALTLLAAAFVASTLTGCSLFKKKDNTAQAPYDPAYEPTYALTSDYPVYEPAPTTYEYPTMTSTTTAPAPVASAAAVRYHTVAKKDTLYAIARMYYNGDHTRWKEIYEANRADIANPNMIRVGQRLVIP